MSSRPVVLVTGAARRVGREIALHLAAAGYDIAVHCRSSRDEAEQTARDARSAGAADSVDAAVFSADLADEAACNALVPAVAAHFGRLDAVVNNASTFEYDDLAGFSHAAMERHWRANTAPAVLLTRALHKLLGDGEARGCVVNLSDHKLWNLHPDHFSYTLSKAALEAATQMLAQACAPQLRVCGVAPGLSLPSGPMSEEEFAGMAGHSPLRRLSSPHDIARTVLFLLESPAITGTTLLVDGGQHLQPQPRDVQFLPAPE
ncbi:SDR family oxidoreductase [Piscinibacter sakaiensis]|uniref:SDR family oxidoreductase n=1 Tax=Piscinibacter sakaiensis TaxID=1547922 RepID=UPI003AADD4E2